MNYPRGRFKEQQALFEAVTEASERRYELRTGLAWHEAGLDGLDGAQGTKAYLSGQLDQESAKFELRARRIHRLLRAALSEVLKLYKGGTILGAGHECGIRLGGLLSRGGLGLMIQKNPWLIEKRRWSPEMRGTNQRTALFLRLTQHGGSEVLGFRDTMGLADFAAVSWLVGNRPPLPRGWKTLGMTIGEVLLAEADYFKGLRRRRKLFHSRAGGRGGEN